ncbi:MAG: YceD family protein [Bacteroidota bacterium]
MKKSFCTIPFSGWKNGPHKIDFELDQTFFESFPTTEFDGAKLHFAVELNKQETMLELDIDLTGTVQLPCDRCGEIFNFNLEGYDHLLVKFSHETQTDEDEVWTLGPSEYQLDLTSRFYELVILSLPARRMHVNEIECNVEVVQAIETYSVEKDSDDQWKDIKNFENFEFNPSDEEE